MRNARSHNRPVDLPPPRKDSHMTSSLADYPAERIAIVKPSALGDIVHALPVLTALRQRYPHAHITWVVNASFTPLLEGHPDLDALLPFDRRRAQSPFRAVLLGWRLFRALRRGCFDLAVDL